MYSQYLFGSVRVHYNGHYWRSTGEYWKSQELELVAPSSPLPTPRARRGPFAGLISYGRYGCTFFLSSLFWILDSWKGRGGFGTRVPSGTMRWVHIIYGVR